MRAGGLLAVVAVLTTACWVPEPATLPAGATGWAPLDEAPAGWVLAPVPTGLTCPDGTAARAWIVRPETPDGPLPVAVVVHGGALDHPLGAGVDTDAGPTGLQTWRTPTRLSDDWASRRAWAVLGRWVSDDQSIDHRGALAVALAEAGVASLVPAQCWGDLGVSEGDNDQASDGFARRGGAVTRWAWRLAAEEGALAAEGVDLGVRPDTGTRILVGLAEGGRGVGALLHDATLPAPTALLLDSVEDDLSIYWDSPANWPDVIESLERIWPEGPAAAAAVSVASAPLPADTLLLRSSTDPSVVVGSQTALVPAVEAAGGQVIDTTLPRHVQAAGDLLLAREAVGILLGGGDDTDDTDDTDG
jgi:hypothetical protein